MLVISGHQLHKQTVEQSACEQSVEQSLFLITSTSLTGLLRGPWLCCRLAFPLCVLFECFVLSSGGAERRHEVASGISLQKLPEAKATGQTQRGCTWPGLTQTNEGGGPLKCFGKVMLFGSMRKLVLCQLLRRHRNHYLELDVRGRQKNRLPTSCSAFAPLL